MFLKEDSAGEMGTSFAEMNRTDNSNAKKGPKNDSTLSKIFMSRRQLPPSLQHGWSFLEWIVLKASCIQKLNVNP